MKLPLGGKRIQFDRTLQRNLPYCASSSCLLFCTDRGHNFIRVEPTTGEPKQLGKQDKVSSRRFV